MSESETLNDIKESKPSLVHLKHIQRWLNETHFCKSYVVIKSPSRHFPTRFHFWARTSLRGEWGQRSYYPIGPALKLHLLVSPFSRYCAAHAHALGVHVTMYVARLQSTGWHLEV